MHFGCWLKRNILKLPRKRYDFLCNLQPPTCVNLDFQLWQPSSTRNEHNCCLWKMNFVCVCQKHDPILKSCARNTRLKFPIEFLIRINVIYSNMYNFVFISCTANMYKYFHFILLINCCFFLHKTTKLLHRGSSSHWNVSIGFRSSRKDEKHCSRGILNFI